MFAGCCTVSDASDVIQSPAQPLLTVPWTAVDMVSVLWVNSLYELVGPLVRLLAGRVQLK